MVFRSVQTTICFDYESSTLCILPRRIHIADGVRLENKFMYFAAAFLHWKRLAADCGYSRIASEHVPSLFIHDEYRITA